MIYPAKIYNNQGELIRVISSETQIEKFWGSFEIEGSDPIKKKKNTRKIICELAECKKVKWVYSAQARFCSNRCAVRSNNAKMIEERAIKAANRPLKKCVKCGKGFKAAFSNSQHCNDPCKSTFTRTRDLTRNKTKE